MEGLIPTGATLRYTKPPTWYQRWALRCIGVGMLLLTDRPLTNLWRYGGCWWRLGCWTLELNGKVIKEGT